LVCQLETYFGLVQDPFGSVQGCFGSSRLLQFGLVLFKIPCFGSVQGCFGGLRLLQFGLVWFGSRYLQFGSRLLWQFKVASVWFKVASV
jgi:hypothetical protein